MAEKKKTENKEQNEKVMTKYDLKVQKKKEQQDKQKKEDRKSVIISILVILLMVAVVASFPIRTYLATHETYVKIEDEEITKVEFDLNYNLTKSNYISQWGTQMSYFGFDANGDLSTQMYSDTLSWKDFFEKKTVEQLKQNVALKQAAEAEGFVYDTTAEYEQLVENLKEVAAKNNMSEKDFIKSQYGSYATLGRISEYLKETMYLNAYYEKLVEEKTPSMEEIEALYKENPDLYDAVDYRITMITADITSDVTDEQLSKAMADAKTEAEGVDASTGELVEGDRWGTLSASVREWLYDTARKAGDTTVIEDDDNFCYYVVQFENRYLNEEPTVDARVLISSIVDGEAVLEEWKKGEATEESFAALCDKYSEDTVTSGGLYEALMSNSMDETLSAWLFDASRATGDTVSLKTEDGMVYVMYYIGANDPEWVLDAKQAVIGDVMTKYLTDLKDAVTVEDPNGKLNYLKIEAAEETDTASSEAIN